MRRLFIAGNWKMNNGPGATKELLSNLKSELPEIPGEVDVLACPPYVSIPAAVKAVADYDVDIGAQDLHFEDDGAFTGEISSNMIKEVGCTYVIVGHSERREFFGDTDITVNKKILKALDEGLMPIVCVGESIEQRKSGQHVDIVKKQVESALVSVEEEQAEEITIAYEPIWAIGTGETASPDQAQEMHKEIRTILANVFDEDTAESIRILYGGSMKPHNAEELLSQTDVDGGLIGGASLKADSFSSIITTAKELS